MENKVAYPYVKVILCFLMCPGLVVGYMFIKFIWGDFSPSKFHVFPVAMALGLILYGAPALLLGIFYSILKLHRSLLSMIIVFLCGTLGAYLWSLLLDAFGESVEMALGKH
jgi:hypothetical protein